MSTATLDELRRALVERRRLEEAFKQNVINRITAILQGLRDCPAPPPGSPAAAALDLTRAQLDAFINELTHPDNLTDAEAQRIASTVDRADLRRVGGPTRQLPPAGPVSAPPPYPGRAPTSWFPWSRPAAPAPAPLGNRPSTGTELTRRPTIYGDDDDDLYDSLGSRGSSYSSALSQPDWLRDVGGPLRGERRNTIWSPPRGGWKSPRKRKPRGTKKYQNKV